MRVNLARALPNQALLCCVYFLCACLLRGVVFLCIDDEQRTIAARTERVV